MTLWRNEMWSELHDIGCLINAVTMCRIFKREIFAKVKICKHLSSEFKVNNGLRQGDAIAPLLFNVVLGTAIRRCKFNAHGSAHLNSIPMVYPTRCNIIQFVLFGNCSTCFEWYFHPSSGAQTTVTTASGIFHTVTDICRYRGRVGTGLSVLWVAYT